MINYIPIKLEKVYEDKVKGKILTLDFDPMYRRSHHKRIYGESIGDQPELGIRKGDTVYFHYNETDHEHTHPEDKLIYYISKHRLFCFSRKGKLTMLNNFALCKPYYGEDVTESTENGVIIRDRVKNGIIVEPDVKPDDRWATLKYTNKEDLKPYIGKLVYRAESTNFENKIEGEDLFVMEDDLIYGYKE